MSSTRRTVALTGAFAIALTTAMAGGSLAQDASPEAGESPAAGDLPGAGLRIGFVSHVIGDPFIQQIADGARAAAAEMGAEIQVDGPAGFDPDAQLLVVQGLVDAGIHGIATSVPGESMNQGLNAIIESGIPVVQFNLLQTGVNAPYVGERSTESGRILGRKVLEQLGGPEATGKVILGICVLGFPVLENRARGVQEVLAEAPGLEVIGPFDVKVAANENYAAWNALITANPDTVANIGLCAPDVDSLGQIQSENPDLSFVSGGYDLTAGNLDAIKTGTAYVTLGQTPFMQGYLPVKILIDQLTGATDVDLSAGGFIDVGSEVVTADSIELPYDLPAPTFEELESFATDVAAWRAFNQPLVDGIIANWPEALEPIENESQ